jgi:hypothetical protein
MLDSLGFIELHRFLIPNSINARRISGQATETQRTRISYFRFQRDVFYHKVRKEREEFSHDGTRDRAYYNAARR